MQINIIVSIILMVIVGMALVYIYKEKKKGTKCIGCPNAYSCSKQSGCFTVETIEQIRRDIQEEKGVS